MSHSAQTLNPKDERKQISSQPTLQAAPQEPAQNPGDSLFLTVSSHLLGLSDTLVLVRHNNCQSANFTMILFLGAPSVGWLAITAFSAVVVYFALRLTAKRRFYRSHDIVCLPKLPQDLPDIKSGSYPSNLR